MSNAFNNFLSSTGHLNGHPNLRDYQHASRLYVDDHYAYSPKVGFLYYVVFNINPSAIIDQAWKNEGVLDVGLLVKKVDLPKFTIATETLNQYNRKTVVPTKLTYTPVSVEFHDDNFNIINKLWVNYYKNYFADSTYGTTGVPKSFGDTKYGETDYQYGIYNNNIKDSFFSSIEIYSLHQQNFTQVTLVNPKITEWAHDSMNQAEGSKIMQNRMTLSYENVLYDYGQIIPGSDPVGFTSLYYDKTPSPLQVAGNPKNSPAYVQQETGFDKPGSNRVFGKGVPTKVNNGFDNRQAARAYGKVGGSGSTSNMFLDIAMLMAKNYVNTNGIVRTKAETYNIANGALGAVTKTAPGKYYEPPNTENQLGIFTLPGGIGINIFKGFNTGVNGQIRANPAAIIFPRGG
jgi:hypothetical protein